MEKGNYMEMNRRFFFSFFLSRSSPLALVYPKKSGILGGNRGHASAFNSQKETESECSPASCEWETTR